MKKTTAILFTLFFMLLSSNMVLAWDVRGTISCGVRGPALQGVVVDVVNTSGTFHASTTSDDAGIYRIRLRDVPDTYTLTVDLSSLPPGAIVFFPPSGNSFFFDTSVTDRVRQNFLVDSVACQQSCELQVDKGCTVLVPPDPVGANDCQGKATSVVFEYTGDNCDASANNQDKDTCVGDPGGANPVRIVATNKRGSRTYLDQSGISPGDTVGIIAAAGGRTELEADTLVTIFDNGNALQELRIHTSCSQPLNVMDQFGSLALVELESTLGGLVMLPPPGDPNPPDPLDECVIVRDAGPFCESGAGVKVEVLQLQYLGGDCEMPPGNDQGGKFECGGDADAVEPVRILATNKKGTRTFLDQSGIGLGDTVDIISAAGSKNELEADTLVTIFHSDGSVLQELKIHTSCSQDLLVEDRFGSVVVTAIDNTGGGMSTAGAEVLYTYKITNTGGVEATDITIVDDQFGVVDGSPIASLVPGEMVTLEMTELVESDTTNRVTVSGDPGACVAEDTLTVSFEDPPPPPPLSECTTKVQATLLRYIGPVIIAPATIEIKPDKFGSQVFVLGSLVPGDELSFGAENGFTIDATAHGQVELGAKTRIFINGVEEVLHTSCSTPFVANAPAPLDKPKGNPSGNWFVVSFDQK